MTQEVNQEHVAKLKKFWELLFFTAQNSIDIYNDDYLMKTVQQTKEQATAMFHDKDPLAEYNWATKILLDKFQFNPEKLRKSTVNQDTDFVELQLAKFEKSRALVKMKTGRPTPIMDGFYEYVIGEKKEKEILAQQKKQHTTQLKTSLTDTQRGLLFDLLVKGRFILIETDKDGFIWAFGGKNDKYLSFSAEWLKEKNLAVYLIDRLCYDESKKLQSNYLSIGSKIFGIKNMAQIRNGYINNDTGVPFNSKQIDEILNNVKGAV